MLLGAHCSIAGGFENAFIEAERLGIDTFQIFSRNQRQWKAKPISPEEKKAFSEAFKKSKVKITFSHTSYLINLASDNEEIHLKSIEALLQEVQRCTVLGLSYCVLHPGAAGTQTKEAAIKRIASALRVILDNTPESSVKILLENTAGQGSSVGGSFENLAAIKERVESDRIGYCFDTCHAFVAGYDISTEAGFEEVMGSYDKILGLDNLHAFHLNDSKGGLGSHLDRHEHIGKGKLGIAPFKIIMQRFKHIPKVLETPKENDMDVENLKLLRSLA